MSNNNFNEKSYSKEITVIILTSTFIVLFSYFCDLCLYNIKIMNENQIIFTFEQISYGNEFASDFNYNNLTSDELHNAIKFLNLPIWIRSYEHCNSSKSEISCQSIIKASESIKSWINTTSNSDYSQYVYSSVQNGLSNRMVYFLGAVLGAIALNLPLIIDPPHEIYNYAKEIKYMPDILNIRNQSDIVHLYNHTIFYNIGFSEIESIVKSDFSNSSINSEGNRTNFNNDTIFNSITNSYHGSKLNVKRKKKIIFDFGRQMPFFGYTHRFYGSKYYEYFGIHAIYFAANFFFRFPQFIIDENIKHFESIPKMIKIVGIHARSHNNHERFIGNIDLFVKQLKLYLTRDKFKGMYLISLATDSSQYEKKIKKVYKNRVMTMNNVTRKADADQLSSITDFIFLMFSDRLIGSYHSTYSSMIAIMSGITMIVYGNDWKCFVKYSNSQVGLLYFLYQNKQEYCPLVNMKIRLYSKDEQMIRAYFRYLIL